MAYLRWFLRSLTDHPSRLRQGTTLIVYRPAARRGIPLRPLEEPSPCKYWWACSRGAVTLGCGVLTALRRPVGGGSPLHGWPASSAEAVARGAARVVRMVASQSWGGSRMLAVRMGLVCLVVGTLGGLAGGADRETSPGAVFYVAPAGDDAWSGRRAEPNAARSDGPFATLPRARDEIRRLKQAGPLPAGGVTVYLAGGLYPLASTLEMTAADSGTADAPVVYRAAAGQRPVILGGRTITGFKPYKGQILQADLAGQGFQGVHFRQLFFDGRRQHLARYPNFDANNPYGGGWAYADGKPVPMYQDVPGESRRQLTYKPADARSWAHPEEVEVFVFPRYNWWNNIVRIKSIDPQQRRVTLAGDCSYPIRPGDRYYVQNALEELDAPGEWYLDSRPAGPAKAAGSISGRRSRWPAGRCTPPRCGPSSASPGARPMSRSAA